MLHFRVKCFCVGSLRCHLPSLAFTFEAQYDCFPRILLYGPSDYAGSLVFRTTCLKHWGNSKSFSVSLNQNDFIHYCDLFLPSTLPYLAACTARKFNDSICGALLRLSFLETVKRPAKTRKTENFRSNITTAVDRLDLKRVGRRC